MNKKESGMNGVIQLRRMPDLRYPFLYFEVASSESPLNKEHMFYMMKGFMERMILCRKLNAKPLATQAKHQR